MEKPERVDIRFGYNCNNNCSYCIVQGSRNKYKDMTTSEIKKLVKEAADRGAKQISLTGGEPTIRKDIFEVCKYANSFDFETIMFTTNGRMLSYIDFIKKLNNYGVNKFMISLPAHTDEMYKEITKTDGFQQVIDGIKNVVKLDLSLCVSFVVCNQNYYILPEFAKYLENLTDIELLQMTFVMPCGPDMSLNKKNIPKLSKAAENIKKVIDKNDFSKIRDIIVMDVPICFLIGYERYINEFNIPDMEVHAPNPEHSSDDYNKRRRTNKKKPEQCKKCKYDNICEGVWPQYLELHGNSEIKPVEK